MSSSTSTIDEYEEIYAPILLDGSKHEAESLLVRALFRSLYKYGVTSEYEELHVSDSILLEGNEEPENPLLQAFRHNRYTYGVNDEAEYEGLHASDSILLEGSKEPENLLLQAIRQNGDKYGVSAEYEGLCALESILLEGTTKPENLLFQALRNTRDKYDVDEYEGLSALESTLEGSTKPENLSLQVLRHITNNFSEDQIIGHGGSAVVYKVNYFRITCGFFHFLQSRT